MNDAGRRSPCLLHPSINITPILKSQKYPGNEISWPDLYIPEGPTESLVSRYHDTPWSYYTHLTAEAGDTHSRLCTGVPISGVPILHERQEQVEPVSGVRRASVMTAGLFFPCPRLGPKAFLGAYRFEDGRDGRMDSPPCFDISTPVVLEILGGL